MRGSGLESDSVRGLGFRFIVSLRSAGSMSLVGDASCADQRSRFLANLAYPEEHFCCGKQIHEKNIVTVDSNTNPATPPFPGTDGLLCRDGSRALGVFTADCLSLALLDPESGAMALVHSGWRGSRLGIAQHALEQLSAGGSKPQQVHAVCGPSIQVCCYRVGPEFRDCFPSAFLQERAEGLFFDNQGYVLHCLQGAGIPEQQLLPNPYCTVCKNDLFYSYRREGKAAGRNLTVLFRDQV